MSKVKLIRQANLDQLKARISENLSAYLVADVAAFPDREMVSFEIDIEADLDALSGLKPTNSHDDEVFNCLLVHKALQNVKPELARDERLWAYITHYHALKYAAKRWPASVGVENKERYIRNHYFADTKRGIERDNAISRLWWMAFIANKAATGSLEENLGALLQFSDVRASIIERPSTGRSNKVLTVVLEMLRSAHVLYKKDNKKKGIFERLEFRRLMSRINAMGGYVLLDALPTNDLKALIAESVSSNTVATR